MKNEEVISALLKSFDDSSAVIKDILYLKSKIEIEGMTDEAIGKLYDLCIAFETIVFDFTSMLKGVSK